jgi:hypothetical protein
MKIVFSQKSFYINCIKFHVVSKKYMKKKSGRIFFLNKSIATRPPTFPPTQNFDELSKSHKSEFFLVEFFALIQNICWMLHTDLFWLKKVYKTRFLVKFPKSGKTPPKKKIFFFFTK